MNDGKRRHWTAAAKLRIVLAGLQGADVSELCRREGLNPTMYDAWKKKLLGSASAIFEQDNARNTAQEQKSAASDAVCSGYVGVFAQGASGNQVESPVLHEMIESAGERPRSLEDGVVEVNVGSYAAVGEEDIIESVPVSGGCPEEAAQEISDGAVGEDLGLPVEDIGRQAGHFFRRPFSRTAIGVGALNGRGGIVGPPTFPSAHKPIGVTGEAAVSAGSGRAIGHTRGCGQEFAIDQDADVDRIAADHDICQSQAGMLAWPRRSCLVAAAGQPATAVVHVSGGCLSDLAQVAGTDDPAGAFASAGENGQQDCDKHRDDGDDDQQFDQGEGGHSPRFSWGEAVCWE